MADFRTKLADEVSSNCDFRAAYDALQRDSLSSLLNLRPRLNTTISRKLLRSALIFAQSSRESHFMLAQNIAYCLAASPISNEERVVCRHIMASVGNFPAGDFISSRVSDDCQLPWQLEMSELARREGNTVLVSGKPELFTDFQRNVWTELKSRQYLSVSAPTSAGKSYTVQAFIKETLEKSDGVVDIAYIVPSRSLIHEIQGNLSRLLGTLPNPPLISSVPRARPELASHQSRVFVFTQERLRTALEQSDLLLDIVIVDEAQQIADGARGMLLQNCLEDVTARMPHSKLLFITPGAQSAVTIGTLLGVHGMTGVGTNLRPVRQNLIFVNFEEAKRDDHMVLTLQRPEGGGTLHVGKLVAKPAETEVGRFIEAILRLGDQGQSLVYASSKHPAESIANELAKASRTEPNARLHELAVFIRKHVHPEFTLANCVERGVAFHFGNMPTNITKAIEEYFVEGLLHTLVCTSTLLQGVNLPARNIFLFKPEKGNHVPMNPDDFWNLAGRAGRLKKDTHGNVFLVSYDTWKNRPAHEPPSTEVTAAFTAALTSEQKALVKYAQNPRHRSGVRQTAFAESVFSRLLTDLKTGTLNETLKRVAPKGLHQDAQRALEAVEKHALKVTLPSDVLKRHTMISPLRQQQMYDVLAVAARSGRLEEHLPLHPHHKYFEGKARFMFILSLIHEHFECTSNRAHRYYGWFGLSWMRGRSLYEMIDFQLKRARARAEEAGYKGILPAGDIIKIVMKQIEEQLRFKYVKFVACYIELLRLAAQVEKGIDLQDIPPIPLFLELERVSNYC